VALESACDTTHTTDRGLGPVYGPSSFTCKNDKINIIALTCTHAHSQNVIQLTITLSHHP
jgi:hypothetical protein